MLNTQLKENLLVKKEIRTNETFPLFLLEYNNLSQDHYWYKGIISEEDTNTEDNSIKILDKVNAIEFILPEGTALFAEIFIKDLNGNLVWKTQTLNNNRVIWYKKNLIGKKIPEGKYYLHIKQGDIVLRGIVII